MIPKARVLFQIIKARRAGAQLLSLTFVLTFTLIYFFARYCSNLLIAFNYAIDKVKQKLSKNVAKAR